MFRLSQQHHDLAFSDALVSMAPSRQRADILKAISNLMRYIDIRYDTYLHEELTKWFKRKELKWASKSATNTYEIAKSIKLEEVLQRIAKLPYKYKIFTLFMLVSGLRTEEAIRAFNNHERLCNNSIMEIFWDRGTKKTNAVYCHPLLHDKIRFKVSKAIYLPKGGNLTKRNLGFELKLLRKLNYTVTATKIDWQLSEWLQGRRGSVSQKHYFLPMMDEYKDKWEQVWTTVLQMCLTEA